MDLAEKFRSIFAGLDRAHGTYAIPEGTTPDGKGKIKGRAITHPFKKKDGSLTDGAVTLELWQRHLAGDYGLGIVPIRDDATCVFGAIDVDVYPLDLSMLVTRCSEMMIPLVVCRTKSGGAHLYLFTKAPVPAKLMRKKLTEWAAALGYPKCEIFPKQDALTSEVDIGNWINIPYFGGATSLRYAMARRSLTPAEFVMYYDRMAVADEAALEDIEPVDVPKRNDEIADDAPTDQPKKKKLPAVEHDLLPGAPPCLTRLATDGFPPGARNNGMFNLMVYAKKRLPDGQWQEEAKRLAAILTPSQDTRDIAPMIGAVGRKTYGYKCKDQPICDVCDKSVCKTRDFGVGGGASVTELNLTFGTMTKVLTKPVIWLWEVDGELVDFETADLMNQKLFQARMMEALNRWPLSVKPGQWRDLIQQAIETATPLEVPEDATSDGQLWDYLTRFCTSRVAGKELDELLMGRPYTDATRSYFVASDFVAYLVQHRFPNRINERLLYLSLRDRELQHHRTELKGKTLAYWSVPAFKAQSEEHAIPVKQAPEAM